MMRREWLPTPQSFKHLFSRTLTKAERQYSTITRKEMLALSMGTSALGLGAVLSQVIVVLYISW